ncbi:STAS/SEC14 domain-containing protein [Zhongshania borealis]|uniref:STAS/SEC14 domain-containing protein n=1 Tax=Zhongshania borealis TaxID=889488 RepID=A0ABP7W658_9GAMM
MINQIFDLPPQIIGFVASGKVTASDYESILIPAIEEKLKGHDNVRILYHLGPTFTGFSAGAMWDDAKLGFAHFKAWEKIAIVTDVEWLKSTIGFLKFAIPCPLKIFANEHYEEAEKWLVS